MSTESVKYQLTLCQDIKGVVFDKEETIFKTGEVIQLSYDQYRSMCANAYTYISVNVAHGHNIAVKIQTYEEEETPLQIKLNQLGKVLGTLTIVICIIVFIVGMLQVIWDLASVALSNIVMSSINCLNS